MSKIQDLLKQLIEVTEVRRKTIADAEFFTWQNNKEKAHESWKKAKELKRKQRDIRSAIDALRSDKTT